MQEATLTWQPQSFLTAKPKYRWFNVTHTREKLLGLQPNLSFPSGLNAGAPRKESWWLDLREEGGHARRCWRHAHAWGRLSLPPHGRQVLQDIWEGHA